MTDTFRGVIVRTTGETEQTDVRILRETQEDGRIWESADRQWIGEQIGARYVEHAGIIWPILTSQGVAMYADEEGLINDSEYNPAARRVTAALAKCPVSNVQILGGNILFIGWVHEDCYDASLTEANIRLIEDAARDTTQVVEGELVVITDTDPDLEPLPAQDDMLAHEAAHQAGSDTLIPRDDCEECHPLAYKLAREMNETEGIPGFDLPV